MPWKKASLMEQRMEFLARWKKREETLTALCAEFGISRQAAYDLRRRIEARGAVALEEDASRAPHRIPHKTADEIVALIVRTRGEHPTWGPKKLRAVLAGRPENQGVRLPCLSTIGEILKREGLITPRPRRRRATPTPSSQLTAAKAPNDVWCADFKGEFRLGDGSMCYPLTITDLHSRYLVACYALESTKTDGAVGVFHDAFREFGLPRVIRTDNGVPFSSTGLAGLSALSVWWMRLGIRPERIEPGQPQQNGQHERMHRTLKQEAARPAAKKILEQQERFYRFAREFNDVRPHEALGLRPPTSVYMSSNTRMPDELPKLEYPLHDLIRRVSGSGHVEGFKRRDHFYVSTALRGQRVGLREVAEGRWLVSFMSLDLGHFDESSGRFEPAAS